MNINKHARNVAAGLALGLVGLLAGNTVNAQETTKPRIDTVRNKEVKILKQYVELTPTYKPIDFNDDKDPRYTNRPSFKVFNDTKKVEDYFKAGYLEGLSKRSLKVVLESVHKKIDASTYLGRPRMVPLPVEIGNYLTSIINNEGPEIHKKDTLMDKIGNITPTEYANLFKLLKRSDYNEYWAIVSKHNDNTETIETDLKTGKVDTLYNRSQNIAIPLYIRLVDTSGKSVKHGKTSDKSSGTEKTYSKPNEVVSVTSDSTSTDGSTDNASMRIPPDKKSTAIVVGVAPGYDSHSKMIVGQALAGVRVGNLEFLLLGGGGASNDNNTMDFPSLDNKSGTTLKNYNKNTNVSYGGMIGWFPGGSHFEVLGGLQKDNMTVANSQTIRQWVTDAMGNSRDVTFEGPTSKVTQGHYDVKTGVGYQFNNGLGLKAIVDINSKTGKPCKSYIAVTVDF